MLDNIRVVAENRSTSKGHLESCYCRKKTDFRNYM